MNNMIRDLDNNKDKSSLPYSKFFIFVAAAALLGLVTGFALTKITKKNSNTTSSSTKSEKTVGIADQKTFKDSAEGILKEGGIDGEGSFHLQRPGGESQNVYLTSTTVDLSHYLGKKVRVWGETFAGEKAGWLMDVGRLDLIK
ncbi:hypothetical protein B6D29_01840 [Microgenomates bacterium UTCPR1]|nr:MAG: hypothetical protein B6D29_01840 [Microgenomates bacterium UTCPR1]